MKKLTDAEKTRRGALLAAILELPKNEIGRYDTVWGDKTALGLYKTALRILERGE